MYIDHVSRMQERIRIVKGWLEGGKTREKAYSVALSGTRERGADGKVPCVGNTVDVKSATWADPDFDPKQRAFYYARVIEIPTPRWSTYDAFRFGVALPEGAPTSTQERAYTSPICYTPARAPSTGKKHRRRK